MVRRRGTDVLKALALGARAVFVGRPILWGLSMKVRGLVRTPLEHDYNNAIYVSCLQWDIVSSVYRLHCASFPLCPIYIMFTAIKILAHLPLDSTLLLK